MLKEDPEFAININNPTKPESKPELSSIQHTETSSITDGEQIANSKGLNSEAQKEKRELKGLQNQGGTCYMNSLLQALFMTPDFRKMIFRWRYDPILNTDKKDCILYQLQKLFAGLLLSKQPYIGTTGLTNSFQWDYKESFQQQDVQEFMRVLFDAIEQSFEINNTYGVVEDIYSGEGSDFIKCMECGYKSDRATKFYDLQLPVRNDFENICNDSIEKAIFGYLKPEILEGKNAYQCSGCGKHVQALKGSKLVKLPTVLTLQLNRFTLDLNTWQRKKLNDKVSFPMVLNMNHFLDESRQQDFNQTEDLLQQNPLLKVKPFHVKVTEANQIRELEALKIKSQTQGNFDEFLSSEIGDFDESVVPKVQGTLAQKRAAERAAKALEHKKNLQNLKKVTTTKTKSGFDKQKLNTNFFNNVKAKKDEASGWAHDFDNPDSGKVQDASDLQLQLAIKLSLDEKESLSKSSEDINKPIDNLSISVKYNNSAELKTPEPSTGASDTLTLTSQEDSESKLKSLSREELVQTIDSQNKSLIEKYRKEGPFVYELFACLLHQGGAMGGHYYAFIKDVEASDQLRDKWHNFNDYRVSECDLVDIAEMFGGNKGKGVAQTTNAYMLMYRLCKSLNQENEEQSVIPQEVLDEVAKEDETSNKTFGASADLEIKAQRMQLKIVKQTFGQSMTQDMPQKVVFVDRREDTYTTLFKVALTQFCISEDEAPLFRLRAYNVHNNIMMETYTGQEDQNLESLKIYPMKTLILEQRSAQSEFIDYDPTCMVLKINIWKEGITSLAEDILLPSHISVPKDLPMKEFLALLFEKFNLKNPVVMKRNPMLNQRQLEQLPSEKSLSQLRVNEGVNLFVEEAVPSSANEISQWEHEFDLDQNRLQVKFNEISERAETEILYKEFIIVDRRITVLDLKVMIAKVLGHNVNMLIFKRGGTHGAELVEDDQTLKHSQFYNMICLQVQVGTPTIVGQKRIKVFLAQDFKTEEDLIVKDYLYFKLQQLAEIPLSTTQTIADAKRQIIQKLGPIKGDGFEISLDNLDNVILREKQGDDKLTSVMHNDRLLHSYQVFDGKEVALQVLQTPQNHSEISNSFLFMVRVWSPSNWTLSDLQQIFVPKTATLNDLAMLVGERFNIEVAQVQVCKIASSWNFSRIQLPYEQWVSVAGNSSFIASAPFYVSTDGLLIIVKDAQEQERQLTEEEQIKYNTAQFEADQFSTEKGGFKVIGSKSSNVPKEQGVKITVKKQQSGE